MLEGTKTDQVPLPQFAAATSDARTEVGSYFVANYPPFSAWSPDHVPGAFSLLDESVPANECPPLGLYLHIPFCRKRCKFCYFRVYTDKNADDVDVYLDALAREVALYAGRPRLAGRQFEFVYFGGGTPSFLSNDQLGRLVERINQHWRWDAAREVTFECEPGTLKQSKLAAIKSIGVTRLSLGVEHFDDEILETNGRAHKSPEIYRAWEWIGETGFRQVNIDLIAGMVGETDDKWESAVEKALALAPDSVTIYQMELPHNTVISRESQSGGRTAPVASWETKRRWVDHAFRLFEQAGYRVSSGYTLVRGRASRKSPADDNDESSARFLYRDSLWHGADMVGTGVASFSHVGGMHYQNVDQWEDYVGRLSGGALPVARALPTTPRQQLIRELILQMKLGRLDASYFRRKFGREILIEFAEAFAALTREGLAKTGGDEVRLTRSGLLRVDELLPRFFEPEYRGIRYT